MLIANPIYDVVFKRLMENEKVAKFFIGTFLNVVVEELRIRPQEFTYTQEKEGEKPMALTVFRLDFIALIRLENGELQKILIEIQKPGKEIDLMRFRNYLGEQYKKKDVVDGVEEVLPIKTIYILGFKLPTIISPCLHIERQYRDMLTNQTVDQRSRFIERLAHDSYVVQVERMGNKHQTRLEKLLTIFEQAHFIDENSILKNYPYELDEEELKLMVDILHHTGSDPQTRKEIETEQEAWRTINAMFERRERELIEKLEEKDQALSQKELELQRQREKIEALKKKLGGE